MQKFGLRHSHILERFQSPFVGANICELEQTVLDLASATCSWSKQLLGQMMVCPGAPSLAAALKRTFGWEFSRKKNGKMVQIEESRKLIWSFVSCVR